MMSAIIKTAKKAARYMPRPMLTMLKGIADGREIKRGTFRAHEPESDMLAEWIKPGDTVLDIGANRGSYMVRMSALAGASGQVYAFEPIAATFDRLTLNAGRTEYRNVEPVKAAVSDHVGFVRMDPENFYRAHIAEKGERVRCITIDSLNLPAHKPVTLIKIDTEGHELPCLIGARKLLERDHPRLIVEENRPRDTRIREFLAELGYRVELEVDDSPNVVYS
jgi:FkbM family methyltransferase